MGVRLLMEPSALAVARPAAAAKLTALSRRPLTVCLTPLALLGAISSLSALVRTVARTNPLAFTSKNSPFDLPDDLVTAPSGRRACMMARSVLTRILGQGVEIVNAVPINNYSIHSPVSQGRPEEWSVFCETNCGNYLLQINVVTQRIYAIGYVEPNSGPLCRQGKGGSERDLPAGSDAGSMPPLSDQQARRQALRYLSLLGISPQSLQSIDIPGREASPSDTKRAVISAYNFAFDDARHPCGMVFVTVDRGDGKLLRVWSRAHVIGGGVMESGSGSIP